MRMRRKKMKNENHVRETLKTSESSLGEREWLEEARKILPYDVYTRDDMAKQMRQVIASTLRWVLEEETNEAKEITAKVL